MNNIERTLAPGARIVVRDAEWLVKRADRTVMGGQRLDVIGISELVRDKEAVFLTELDTDIEILDPAETKLVQDDSSNYRSTLLFIESLLRKTPPTDDKLYIGYKAAMDHVSYQFDPAIKALKQPRQRILVADAVGLGKTLEAGILISELIKRGKGKRILVLAVKSMLTQFQKEMWSRFTIPLTRLDSIGIQRIRSKIPTNHNPFYYYDKSIISIDTLKQNSEYRNYIENSWWDIIVIDEAHNVARRGNNASHRSKLAQLLSKKSDTLIMLSATPHDGKAASFASLMNMLDPTAIANSENYGPDDIKGLYIRRFKKDIQGQVEKAFMEREISTADCNAGDIEEDVFDYFSKLEFDSLDKKRTGSMLFKVTLEKSLFSSPAACMQTLNNRIKRLEDKNDDGYESDIEKLQELVDRIDNITAGEFSKYNKLLDVIKDKKTGFGWTGKDKEDRLVIFTERIETLHFLHSSLLEDLKLKKENITILHGGMSDIDQQHVVEEFGKNESPLRLLIASDVASEGINLHYLSHRLIHFDIPWSLMVFQQRNGRIDRYGQEKTPQIVYLVTRSENSKIRGDMRVLELLIQKDEETVKNIGDPAEFYRVYDVDEEENLTAKAMEEGKTPDEIKEALEDEEDVFDPFSIFDDDESQPTGESTEESTSQMLSLFPSDYSFLKETIEYLKSKKERISANFYDYEKRVDIRMTEDLKYRFKYLPSEIKPNNDELVLSADTTVIQTEIKRSRKDEKAWPVIHYLWEQNPVLEWATDKVMAAFNRHEAPVMRIDEKLGNDETVIVLSGLIPNRKGHPIIHRWVGVNFKGGNFTHIESFEKLVLRLELNTKRFSNPGHEIDVCQFKKFLPVAVNEFKGWMSDIRNDFQTETSLKLEEKLNELKKLKSKKYEQLEFDFEGSRLSETRKKQDIETGQRKINSEFEEYQDWIKDTMTTENQPYVQVVAVFTA